ncbi:NVEALA domain-containing protein [Phocaeicola paurosaccharolyticus]|jgi:hypothetical protein|uniref:NVEALA domain-containing protein n=1 Tax=Phocaeicola paurosaccharolyticus TaxID=732242 RepID=UPI0004692A88|nr:NVEALA domain-containing protein [Phocaeicola paurosaccharolyticus]
MKKLISKIIALLIITIITCYNINATKNDKPKFSNLLFENIEAMGQSENGDYSCTVTVDCSFPLQGTISCTGKVCKRGLSFSSGAYVECDGRKTYC